MKKNKYIIGTLLVLVISLLFIEKNDKYIEIEGYQNTQIMVSLNGKIQGDFPSKDNSLYYDVDVNCDNADGRWDYKNWKLLINNLTAETTCSVAFTSTEKKSLYDKIVSDWNETDGTNNIYKENHDYDGDEIPDYYEYRYEGTDTSVNNYVLFNDELWRIIGAFPQGTPTTVSDDGTINFGDGAPSTNNTVKIIRDESLGSFSWDADNTNDWTTAELNTNILNNLYLNSSSGTCDYYSTTVDKTCSFVKSGLANVTNYLETATWYLGGVAGTAYSTADTYLYERGASVYEGRPIVTASKVGLMNTSDYGYAVNSNSCARTALMNEYESSNCGGNSWLLKYTGQWFLTPNSGSASAVLSLSYNGIAESVASNRVYVMCPVIYLKSSVNVIGGDGKINNPFQVSL